MLRLGFSGYSKMESQFIPEFLKLLIGQLNLMYLLFWKWAYYKEYTNSSDASILTKLYKDPQKSIRCSVCLKWFKNMKGLSQHMGKKHSESKGAECYVCGKLFKHQKAVKFHVYQVHERRTRVKCNACGKLLYNKYVLEDHMRRKHSLL